MNATGETMTLLFERAALERLADPEAVFEDAEQWTAVIGLVSDEAPEQLSSYADRENIDPDLLSSAGNQTGGLAVVRQQFSTDRHVFVGTTDEARQLAQSLGWEFLTVAEAAEAADWTRTEDANRWREDRDEE